MKKLLAMAALVLVFGIPQAYASDMEEYDFSFEDAYEIPEETLDEPAITDLSESLSWAIYSYMGVDELESGSSTLCPAAYTVDGSAVYPVIRQTPGNLHQCRL